MRENKRNSRDDKSNKEEKRNSSENFKKNPSSYSKSDASSSSRKPTSRTGKSESTSNFNKDRSSSRYSKENGPSGKSARFSSDRKPFSSSQDGERSYKPKKFSADGESNYRDTKSPQKFSNKSNWNKESGSAESKGRNYVKKDTVNKKFGRPASASKDVRPFRKRTEGDTYKYKNTEPRDHKPTKQGVSHNLDGKVRLNRYIANAGICSRRKADELIEAGVISVNNEVVSELGFKVDPAKDVVKYNGALLKREKKVYVLLNKPKDYITTTEDPQERRTVMHLVEKASRERIYPVGRLDRNTTGLLLMTNDGDLADKLSHPKNGITKIYQVELNKSLSQGDLNKIQFGLELEDGLIKPDNISYVTGGSKKEIGIQIHSGKNRIVRRIFEHLGYDVVKLDRVVYGNLTKKDLPRGRWRYLDEHELIQIKHLIK